MTRACQFFEHDFQDFLIDKQDFEFYLVYPSNPQIVFNYLSLKITFSPHIIPFQIQILPILLFKHIFLPKHLIIHGAG